MIKSHDLSKPWFNRLIESRKKFLNAEQFKTLDELEKYGDGQIASIYYILLDCLAVKNVDCDHVASHLGNNVKKNFVRIRRSKRLKCNR